MSTVPFPALTVAWTVVQRKNQYIEKKLTHDTYGQSELGKYGTTPSNNSDYASIVYTTVFSLSVLCSGEGSFGRVLQAKAEGIVPDMPNRNLVAIKTTKGLILHL